MEGNRKRIASLRRKWRIDSASREETIIACSKANPDRKPDGSFVEEMMWRAFWAGRKMGREEAS